MAWTQGFASAGDVEERAERALRWPLGAASPLWAVFGAAASAGVAWWWLTRWTRPVNVEALVVAAVNQATIAVEAATDSELRVEEAVVTADVVAKEIDASTDETHIVAPTPQLTAELEEPAADDLTRMTGIGPKLSVALAERGVTRFAQIAAWTQRDLADVDAALSLKGRAIREAWVAQAKRLAQG